MHDEKTGAHPCQRRGHDRQKRDQRQQDGSAEYGPAEVRTLAATFNAMIDRVKKPLDSLEMQVRERTAQLSRSNTEFLVSNKDKGTLIAELQEALQNVKILSGLLPICSSCKKIRNGVQGLR